MTPARVQPMLVGSGRAIEMLRDLGVDYLVCGWPGQGRGHVEEFWSRIGSGLAGS